MLLCDYIIDLIDHILSTASVDRLSTRMRVLDDFIVSDHKPVSCYVEYNTLVNKCSLVESEHSSQVPHWTACNDSTLYKYEIYLDNVLKMVDIPVEVFSYSINADICKKLELISFTVILLIVLR